jgi:hypothetical protein
MGPLSLSFLADELERKKGRGPRRSASGDDEELRGGGGLARWRGRGLQREVRCLHCITNMEKEIAWTKAKLYLWSILFHWPLVSREVLGHV